jgi:hypothetical protein
MRERREERRQIRIEIERRILVDRRTERDRRERERENREKKKGK